MKKYAGWQAVYMSFFSKDLYRDVAQNWAGVGYLYLLLVVAGTSAVFALVALNTVNNLVTNNVEPIIDKFPTLRFANGQMTMDQKSPYILECPAGIIDFDMSDNPQIPKDKKGAVVTKDKYIVIGEGEETANKPIDLKQLASAYNNMTIDPTTLKQAIGMIKAMVAPGVFLIAWPVPVPGLAPGAGLIFGLAGAMIQSLIYGLIALLLAKGMKADLTYQQCIRISVIALTPGMILESIVRIAGIIQVQMVWSLVSIVLALIYVVIAVMANKTVPDVDLPKVDVPTV